MKDKEGGLSKFLGLACLLLFCFQFAVFLLQGGILLHQRLHDGVELGHHVVNAEVQHANLLHYRVCLRLRRHFLVTYVCG